MNLRNFIVRIFGLTTCAASMLAAQASEPRALAIPERDTLQCRYVPVPKTAHDDSTGLALHFQVGRDFPNARSIDVAYDTTGRATSLREHLDTYTTSQGIQIDLLTIIFYPDGRTAGFTVTARRNSTKSDSGDSRMASLNRSVTQLSDQQKTQARRLASWLWEHRCKQLRSRTAATAAPSHHLYEVANNLHTGSREYFGDEIVPARGCSLLDAEALHRALKSSFTTTPQILTTRYSTRASILTSPESDAPPPPFLYLRPSFTG